MTWLTNHASYFALAALLLSEIMPFLPTKANGIADLLVQLLKALAGAVKKTPAAALLPLLGLFAFAGCAHVSGKQVAVDLGQCATPAVQAEIANLLPAVEAILQGQAVDWMQQLAALEQVGIPAVVCAVEVAMHDLAKSPTSLQDPEHALGAARARQYLNYYGIRPAAQ